ncbi:sialate O-acetylesterase [Sphingobacterium sp. SGG-5]|uniref:sialate O-acetylesterase n=1 Tax=Sphingobacterium sp. SGG-5 TaxID=2710881 RepID=UPI0013EB42CB|nr:sialate O-acetylesterase [Sphingobacterium sp. SGG-5]NGM62473.1 sialate O-acetylesterase [Sphingobacterium sp. SGG-5]
MMQKGISFFILLLTGFTALAQLKLPALVADSMVLQRDQPVKIWGWSLSDKEVTILFKDKIYRANPDKDKKWVATLEATQAGGPYSIGISTAGQSIKIKEILFGDVWVCSGQSNMSFAMSSLAEKEADDIAHATNTNIREFQVKRQYSFEPRENVIGKWKQANPENVLRFSAVAYYMAKNLYEKYKIPIGIIHSSWGGTPAEAWTAAEDLKAFPDYLEKYNFYRDTVNLQAALNQENEIQSDQRNGQKKIRMHYQPATLFNAMIAPLIPYTIKGFAWYQGEANTRKAEEYAKLLPALIEGWRSRWQQGDLPFLIVQLANYMAPQKRPSEGGWAWIRESQLKVSQTVPNTALAVAIDIGEAKDIHPLNKKEVGRRLALAAERIAYHDKNVVYSGPTYQSMKKEGNKIILSFTNIGSGLMADGGQLARFAIAGKDKKFVWASAKIEDDQVVVWSEDIKDPEAVRYAWGSNPEGYNLYNREGLPASPFRTDSWER